VDDTNDEVDIEMKLSSQAIKVYPSFICGIVFHANINVCLVVKLSTVSIPHAESYINVHRKHFACREQIAIAGGVYYVGIEEREVPKVSFCSSRRIFSGIA
jgi:hypothetical protein